jgi:hypothetical protein
MLTKKIKYTDFRGVEREDEFMFHLAKNKVVEMEVSRSGGMTSFINRVISEGDGEALMREFRKIIRLSYGKISDDGRRFIQSEELSDEFEQTNAYDVLFMQLVTNAEAAAAFVNGILPKDLNIDDATVKRIVRENEQRFGG